jgi:co-chaperonin GroES (HSP10)
VITPIQGHLLVELKGEFEHIDVTPGRFENTRNRGVVRAMAADITPRTLNKIGADSLAVGSMVYFGKFEDNAPCEVDGKEATLIKLEEIGGIDAAN